ncbi:E3 ubiquitin-protein ligase NEDD4-like [Mizuhopecten yessoensis]|uniref:E3 ubiquitin-protein ligase NEDD4-like n=1 Tax=Mizuhopecten yessoensis TaxID=6573 RepID=UPI000B45C39A|nr:E3 ubiquitin-protein ligase NEDD4-like [Mizuhopecten yessoensis]
MDASFKPVISSTRTSSNADIKSLLEAFQKKINKFDKQEIIVYWKRVLESAFRALKRPHFDVKCKLYVKFSGEIGMDHGGPRREFFRLAIHELSEKSGLFEGADDQKVFRHNLEALQDGCYRLSGKLVGMSLAQDGPAMGFLNRDVFRMMTGLEPDLQEFDLQLIPETDIRNILQQHGDWMLDQGVNNCWHLKIADIPKSIHALVKQTIFYRTASEIQQFARGMDDVCGLTTEMKRDPYKWEDLFCKVGEALTKEKFLEECEDKWSVEGSNRRGREEVQNMRLNCSFRTLRKVLFL